MIRLLGFTPCCARIVRISSTSPRRCSKCDSASSSINDSLTHGQPARHSSPHAHGSGSSTPRTDPASIRETCSNSASVTNGVNGCSSRRIVSNVARSTARCEGLPSMVGLIASRYQSQKSRHSRSYSDCAYGLNSKRLMLRVIDLVVRASRDSIQRSTSGSVAGSTGLTGPPGASPRAHSITVSRPAFHSLLQKFRPSSNFGLVLRPVLVSRSTGRRMSCVCVVILHSVYRIASAPWLAMMSNGSTPFPMLLDIFRPCPSITSAWMNTSVNGRSPSRKYRLNITIRDTHSVMISRAVHKAFEGLNASNNSDSSSGHPIVEIGHSAELNHVSSTSGSCSYPHSCRIRSSSAVGSSRKHRNDSSRFSPLVNAS